MKVTIAKTRAKTLRLRWTYGGRRYSLSDGYGQDSAGLARASLMCGRIESDCALGDFDPTLERYKQKKAKYIPPANPGMYWIWDLYLSSLSDRISHATMRKQMVPISRWLDIRKNIRVADTVELIRELKKSVSEGQVYRYLMQFNAACEWGVKNEYLTGNPLQDQIKEHKPQKTSTKPDPFTYTEMVRIIHAFYGTSYEPLVKFLFYTGCRPGEALGLHWQDVTDSSIRFCQAMSLDTGLMKKGLKTQLHRDFPVNDQLRQVFADMNNEGSQYRLFYTNWYKFTNAVWPCVLKTLGIRRRKAYATRATFITLCLSRGVPIADVAQWVGNSPETIMKHYAGINPDLSPPVL